MKRAIILTAVAVALALAAGAAVTVLTVTPQSAVACNTSDC
jgi:hypothetical protein